MKLLRALLIDSNEVHRSRVKKLLEASHIECVETANLPNLPWSMSRNAIDLVVAELPSSAPDGRSLDRRFMDQAFGPSSPPVILYVDVRQPNSPLLMETTPQDAILIPAPVLADDLHAALDRAFVEWGRSAN